MKQVVIRLPIVSILIRQHYRNEKFSILRSLANEHVLLFILPTIELKSNYSNRVIICSTCIIGTFKNIFFTKKSPFYRHMASRSCYICWMDKQFSRLVALSTTNMTSLNVAVVFSSRLKLIHLFIMVGKGWGKFSKIWQMPWFPVGTIYPIPSLLFVTIASARHYEFWYQMWIKKH